MTCILSLELCINFNLENKLTFTKLKAIIEAAPAAVATGGTVAAAEDTFAETVAEDTFAETVAEVFEAIEEATPAVAAAGGSVAVAAMFAMPPLPMTLASGVPPGIFFSDYHTKNSDLTLATFYNLENSFS